MRRNTTKIVVAVAAIAALAAGGAAFTASNTVPDTALGYGTHSVSGAVVTSVKYTTSGNGSTVSDVDLVITGDVSSKVVEVSFDNNARTACDAGVVNGGGDTDVHCAVNQPTAAVANFNVAVHD